MYVLEGTPYRQRWKLRKYESEQEEMWFGLSNKRQTKNQADLDIYIRRKYIVKDDGELARYLKALKGFRITDTISLSHTALHSTNSNQVLSDHNSIYQENKGVSVNI